MQYIGCYPSVLVNGQGPVRSVDGVEDELDGERARRLTDTGSYPRVLEEGVARVATRRDSSESGMRSIGVMRC